MAIDRSSLALNDRLREARWLAREGLLDVAALHRHMVAGEEPAGGAVAAGELRAQTLAQARARSRDAPCPYCGGSAAPAGPCPGCGLMVWRPTADGSSLAVDRSSLAVDRSSLALNRDLALVGLAVQRGLIDEDTVLALQAERQPDEADLALGQLLLRRRRITAADYLELSRELEGAAPIDPPTVRDPQTPLLIGRYAIIDVIGRGGMGVIYRAHDPELRRDVAIKVLRAEEAQDPVALERFQREAQAAGSLNHPNIVPVYEVGQSVLGPYFAMAYIDGLTLQAYIAKLSPPLEERLRLMVRILDGVIHAHQAGIVHRDLKPGNVLVTAAGEPRITDFGLAKQMGRATLLTHTGTAMGTPFYMPPEQVRGQAKDVDPRSDVYALGVMLYELLTGALPYEAPTQVELYRKILEDDPVPPRARAASAHPRAHPIDADLETICLKAMDKVPARRYPTAADFRADIQRILAGETIAARPESRLYRLRRRLRNPRLIVRLLAATLLGLTVLGGGGYLLRRELDWRRARRDSLDYLAREEAAAAGFVQRAGGWRERLLREAAADPSAQVAMRAARIAGDLGLSALAPALAEGAERAQGLRRLALADQARRLDGRSRRGALQEAVLAGDGAARRYALAEVGTLNEPGAWRVLLPFLDTEGQEAGRAAEVILRLEPGAARELAQEIRAALPDDADAGQAQAAASAIARLRRLAPRDAEGVVLLARSQLACDRPAAAVEVLRAALRADPGEIRLLRALIQAHAADQSARLREITARLQASPDDPQLRLERARLSLAALHFRHALEDARRMLVGRDPESAGARPAEAYGIAAQALLQLREPRQALDVLDGAAGLARDDPQVLLARAMVLYELERHGEALAVLDRALRYEPELARAHVWRGRVHDALGHVEAAQVDFAQALRLGPEDTQVLQMVVGFHRDRGLFAEALALLDRLLLSMPYDPPLHLMRGQLLMNTQRAREAVEAFTLAYELVPEALPLVERARAYQALGRDDRAAADLDQACERWRPPQPQALLERGQMLSRQGLFDEAWVDFNELSLQKEPRWRDLGRLGLATVRFARGQGVDAVAEAAAVEAATDDYEVYNHAQAVLGKLRDDFRRNLMRCATDTAFAADFAQLMAQQPTLRAWFVQLMRSEAPETVAAVRQGLARAVPGLSGGLREAARDNLEQKPERALELIEAAAALDPGALDTVLVHGLILAALSRLAEAEAIYRPRSEGADPALSVLKNLAMIHQAQNRADLACEELGRYIDLKPDDPGGYVNRSLAREQQGLFELALEDQVRALGLIPKAAGVLHRRRSKLALALGRHQEALEAADSALGESPDDHETLVLRGRALHGLGRREEALAQFASAIRAATGDQPVAAAVVEVYAFRGLCQLDEGNLEGAREDLDRAEKSEDEGSGAGAWINYGQGRLALATDRPIIAWQRFRGNLNLSERASAAPRIQVYRDGRVQMHFSRHVLMPDVLEASRAGEREALKALGPFLVNRDGSIDVRLLAREPRFLYPFLLALDTGIFQLKRTTEEGEEAVEPATILMGMLAQPEMASSFEAHMLSIANDDPEGESARGLPFVSLLIKLLPDQPSFLHVRASCLNHTGRLEQALGDIEAVMPRADDLPESFLVLAAKVYEKLERPTEVITMRRRLAERDPSLRRWVELGQALAEAKRLGEARQAFEAARDLPARTNEDLEWKAVSHLQLLEYAPAIAAADELLGRMPRRTVHPTALSVKAFALGGLDRHLEAAEIFRQLVAFQPEETDHRRHLASALKAAGRHQEALRQFLELVRRDPSPWRWYEHIADAYIELGQYDLAAAACTRALQGQDRPSYYITRGHAYLRAGRLEDAERDLRLAVARTSGDEDTAASAPYFLAAVLAHDPARVVEALELLRQAVAAGASRKRIATDPRFEPLRAQPGFAELVAEGR